MVWVWGICFLEVHIGILMGAQSGSTLTGTKTGNGKSGLQIGNSEIKNTVPGFQIASAESQRPNETNK